MYATAPLVITQVNEVERPALDAHLAARSDSCMLLRSNLRSVGLAWTAPNGALYQGQYVLGRRGGVVVGAACHAWNGNVLVQADAYAGELAVAAVRYSGRPVAGLLGSVEQAAHARSALGLDAVRARFDSEELLMALSLDQLVVPAGLRDAAVVGRRAEARDRDLLVSWRVAYAVETGLRAAPDAEARAAATMANALAARQVWVLERAGAVVATCTHNATLPDSVQVGGVFTPPSLRSRGHARAVVAASLLDARAAGAVRGILFTPRPDAVAAYRAIGFAPLARYAVVLFDASA